MVKNSTKFLFGTFLVLLFVSLSFAAHTVSFSGSQSINQSISSIVNISINNTDPLITSNISQVNITLPAGVVFVAGSNNTNFSSQFTNTSNILIWDSEVGYAGLVYANATVYFWFNVTVANPGQRDLTITTLNTSGVTTSYLTLIVNDTVVPVVLSANFSSPASLSNKSGSVLLNVSATDNYNISRVLFNITNSSGQVVTYLGTNISTTNWNASFNSSAYADGFYNVTAYVNDTAGNLNNTARVLFYVDNTAPAVTQIEPTNATSATTTEYNFTFNFTDSILSSNCSLIFDGLAVNNTTSVTNATTMGLYLFSIAEGTHTWSVNCTDSAGNTGSTGNRTLIVTAAAVAEDDDDSGGSGGSSGDPVFYPTATQLNNGYTKLVFEDWKFSFKVNKVSHTLTIKDVMKDVSTTIEVASTPQTKTLGKGEEWKVDLDSDKVYDLLVRVNGISGTRVNLTVKNISESSVPVSAPVTETPVVTTSQEVETETVAEDNSTQTSSGKSLYWIIALVILAIVIYLIFRYNDSERKLHRLVHYSDKGHRH